MAENSTEERTGHTVNTKPAANLSFLPAIVYNNLYLFAVGANSPVIGLILNLFIGIALGANVVIANAVGRKDQKQIHDAVHTSIVAALLGGVLIVYRPSKKLLS